MTEQQKKRCAMLIGALSSFYCVDKLSQKITHGDDECDVKFILLTMAMSLFGILSMDEDDYEGVAEESKEYMGDFAFLDSVASADRDLFGIPNTSSFCLFELLGWTREKTFMTQIDSAKTEEAQRRFRLVVGAFARLMGAFGLLADMGMEAAPDPDECFNMPVTGALCGIACCEDPDCKKSEELVKQPNQCLYKKPIEHSFPCDTGRNFRIYPTKTIEHRRRIHGNRRMGSRGSDRYPDIVLDASADSKNVELWKDDD